MAIEPGGYPVPRYEERREDEVVPQWKTAFGANSNTASSTDDGLIIDTLTALAQACDEKGAEAYNSGFVTTASGLQLDALIGGLFGTQRAPDRPSTGEVVVYGEVGTIVSPAADPSEISNQVGDVYTVQGPVEIVESDIAVFIFGGTTGIATSTSLTIGATTYGPTLAIEGNGAAVAENMSAAMPSSSTDFSVKYPVYTDPAGNGVLIIQLTSVLNTVVTATASDATQFRGVRTPTQSNDTGAISGDAFTLTIINSPISGWEGVTNLEAVALGADADTDAQYVKRHQDTLAKGGTSTLLALQSLLSDENRVPGVNQAIVYENVTNVTDSEGRPPHSFESVVDGGLQSDIVRVIWENHPLGIQSWGQIEVTVEDPRASGQHIVRYSRPQDRYVWCDVFITAGEGFPTEPISDIQNAVATELSNFGNALGIGRDVYLADLGAALTLTGVESLTIFLGATLSVGAPKPPLGNSNLPITDLQISRWDVARIKVVVTLP